MNTSVPSSSQPNEPRPSWKTFARVRWLPVVAVATVGLLYTFRSGSWGTSTLEEDGYYSLDVARSLALGRGIVIDGAQPTTGVQPLWVFVNAALFALTKGDRFSTLRLTLALSSVLWIGLAFLLGQLASERARRERLDGNTARWFAFVLVLGSYSVFDQMHNGLETGLNFTLVAAAALLIERFVSNPNASSRSTGPLLVITLSLLPYSRLDNSFFLLAAALMAATSAVALRREPSRRAPYLRLTLLCGIAALAFLPWLIRTYRLEGHFMPSSGRAQGAAWLPANIEEGVTAVVNWLVPWNPVLRSTYPPYSFSATPVSLALIAVGVPIFAVAKPWRRSLLGSGDRVIVFYMAGLLVYYTWFFGAPYFRMRYFSPLIILVIPILAAALERVWANRVTFQAGAAAIVLLLNVPSYLVDLHLFPTYSAWPIRRHVNENYQHTAAYAVSRVKPECRVGASNSGTLGYFRDRVTNLDGKVNAYAARDRLALLSDHYRSDRLRIDVVVDLSDCINGTLRDRSSDFHRVATFGRAEAWVRRGAEACLDGSRPVLLPQEMRDP